MHSHVCRIGGIFTTILLGWLLSGTGAMGAPANDNFANAEVLDPTENWLERSNVGATAEAGESLSTWVGGGKSVWWRYEAPRDGYMMVSTVGSQTTSYEELDTVLGVFVGTTLSDLCTGKFTTLPTAPESSSSSWGGSLTDSRRCLRCSCHWV